MNILFYLVFKLISIIVRSSLIQKKKLPIVSYGKYFNNKNFILQSQLNKKYLMNLQSKALYHQNYVNSLIVFYKRFI